MTDLSRNVKKRTTPSALAKKLGFGNSTTTSWKKGKSPSAESLLLISKELGVSMDYLMGATDNPSPPNDNLTDEERLAAEIFKMSPEKRKQLIHYAEFLKTQTEFSKELSETFNTAMPDLLPE